MPCPQCGSDKVTIFEGTHGGLLRCEMCEHQEILLPPIGE
jgi:transcription elongation factor Elf1